MSEKILIVDDLQESIDLIVLLLQNFMPESTWLAARNGEDAIRIAQRERPDLVILDVRMPGVDGYEVCRRLKSDPATADSAVLMLSGVLVSPRHRVQGLDGGADGYICKPFQPPEFIAQVRTLLRLKKRTDAIRDHEQDLARELTDRTRLLQESEKKFRLLVEQIPAITYIVELGDLPRTTFISPQVGPLLGFEPREWLADPALWRRQIHPEDAPSVIAVVEAHDRSLEPMDLEYRVLTKAGRVRWFRNQASYTRDGREGLASLHGVMLDITAQKEAESALRESEDKLRQSHKMEALGRLAGGVAHDFNNMLTSILVYSRLLHQAPGLDESFRKDLEEVIHAGERAADLTRQLLVFGRKQVSCVKPTDLNAVVSGMDRLLRRTLGEDIQLVTLLGDPLKPVMVDSAQVEQVIMNLAVNARDAMPRGGKLLLQTSLVDLDGQEAAALRDLKPGPHVVLKLRDTGVGMSPQVREHAFEPFFTTKRPGQGSGLGLSIVYGIVRQFHGAIELSSEPGQGARFKIYLPVTDSGAAVLPQPAEPFTPPGGRETVLLVEDEPTVRRLTARLLKSFGYRVLEAGHGREALDLLCSPTGKSVQVLLTDVVMPHMGGPELVRKLHEHGRRLPVLFMTGFSPEAIVHHGLSEDVIPVLSKPFTPQMLGLKIREILDAADG